MFEKALITILGASPTKGPYNASKSGNTNVSLNTSFENNDFLTELANFVNSLESGKQTVIRVDEKSATQKGIGGIIAEGNSLLDKKNNINQSINESPIFFNHERISQLMEMVLNDVIPGSSVQGQFNQDPGDNDGSGVINVQVGENLSSLAKTVKLNSEKILSLMNELSTSGNSEGLSILAKSLNLNSEEMMSLVKELSTSGNSEGLSTLAKSLNLNRDEMSSLVKELSTSGNSEGLSTLAKSLNLNSDEMLSLVKELSTSGNSEGLSTLAKSLNLNSDEMLSLVKELSTSGNSEGLSTLAKSLNLNNEEMMFLVKELSTSGNSEGLSMLAKSLNLNSEEMLSLVKELNTSGNGEGLSTLVKTLNLNSEEMVSLVKGLSTSGNSEGLSTLAKSLNLNNEEMMSLVKELRTSGDSEGLSTLAKSLNLNSEEMMSLVKKLSTSGNKEGLTSLAKAMNLNSEEILSLAKEMKSGGDKEVLLSLARGMKLKSEELSSLAKSINNNDSFGKVSVVSSYINTLNGAKADNGLNPKESNNNSINEQLMSKLTGKTAQMDNGTNSSKSESEGPPDMSGFTKHKATTTADKENSLNNIKSEGPVNKASVTDNSFPGNQTVDTAKEINLNFANFKQDAGPKINFANVPKQINVTQSFESLSTNVADNIIQRARVFVRGGQSVMKIQLNPPELGSIKLEFTTKDNVLDAKISVERSIVKDMIEKDIPRIRELVSNANVDLGKLDVSLQEKEDGKLAFMDMEFQSDTESQETEGPTNNEDENLTDEIDEDLVTDSANSNEINYLV